MSNNVTRGIRLHVLRPADGAQSTLGPSSRASALTLVGVVMDGEREVLPLPADSRVFEPEDSAPAVALHIRHIGAAIASVIPVTQEEGQYLPVHGTMAGGNFASSHDSRISQLLDAHLGTRFYGALSIHDRLENAQGRLAEV